jgi:succinate dehydrogenase/fumarate reductase iron-sulfur protein
MMIVKISRYNPNVDAKPYYQSYNVPFTAEDHMTVMDLLIYIADNLDSSLSFFSHSACYHGICGRCGIRCNDKVALACETVVTSEEVVIDPINQSIVKDLIVKN